MAFGDGKFHVHAQDGVFQNGFLKLDHRFGFGQSAGKVREVVDYLLCGLEMEAHVDYEIIAPDMFW